MLQNKGQTASENAATGDITIIDYQNDIIMNVDIKCSTSKDKQYATVSKDDWMTWEKYFSDKKIKYYISVKYDPNMPLEKSITHVKSFSFNEFKNDVLNGKRKEFISSNYPGSKYIWLSPDDEKKMNL